MIEPHHLPEEIARTPAPATAVAGLRTLAEVEQEHVLAVLRACHGVQATAARILGIGRNTLWRRLRAYGDGAAGELAPTRTPVPGSDRPPGPHAGAREDGAAAEDQG